MRLVPLVQVQQVQPIVCPVYQTALRVCNSSSSFQVTARVRMAIIYQQRNLVRPESAFNLQAIYTLGPVQPFGDLSTIMGQRGRVVSYLLLALF